MSLQTGIEAFVSADPDFKTAVEIDGPRTDSGVFPVQMPQGAQLPCLVYARIAGHEIDSLDGRGELRVSRVQFSAFGLHYGEAVATANAAKDAFIGFQGTLPDGTEVDAVFLVLENDVFEQVPRIYQVIFDGEIWFRNAGS
jgi:hypothetical protein